jgi:hypothetical protein
VSYLLSVGDNSMRIISEARVFDPQLGISTELTYEGQMEELNVFAETQRLLGAKARVFPFEGPVYRATITIGDAQDGGTAADVDVWERITEMGQEDIRNNPKVIRLAVGEVTLSLWVKDIKAAIRDGVYLTGVVSAQEQALYELYARGADAFQTRKIVLRRRRTRPLTFLALSEVHAIELIYTTAALRTAFAVPAAIGAKLPVSGDFTPSNTAWGWVERADTSTIAVAYNKVEEIKDWVFAAWSTLLYDLA